MRIYKETISLNKNARGCYILDTVKGCSKGGLNCGKGCYGNCYAKNIADRYGFDFSKVKNRNFGNKVGQLFLFGLHDTTHTVKIIRQINKAKMPFIRIGEMGDPSENWEHTISVCKEISQAKRKIVIATKHINPMSEMLLFEIKPLNLCINTSVSALDNDDEINYRLHQFYRLKGFCHSVLRIVSCNFNKDNPEGRKKDECQSALFCHSPNIDTIFRVDKNNKLIKNNIINVKKVKFLRSIVLASINNPKTYFGECSSCPDMCGVNSIGG